MAERTRAWSRLLPVFFLLLILTGPALGAGNGGPGNQAADVVDRGDDDNGDSGGCNGTSEGDPDDYDLTSGGSLSTQDTGAEAGLPRSEGGWLAIWMLTVTRFALGLIGR